MVDHKRIAELKGYYKLSMLKCIGYGSGDLAQNLIYQTVSMYLLFFYTNVYGLSPSAAAIMFLIVRVIDLIWDPLVGMYVDKHYPEWGKYRTYLVFGGLPLAGYSILCFWNLIPGSLVYAYFTYIGLSLCYTIVNVPYGALNASLTRDTNEITKLTTVRMFMANIGGLAVGMGVPYLLKILDPSESQDLSNNDMAWLACMTIYAFVALLLLFFCFSQCEETVVMDRRATKKVKFSDLWMEFVQNRPLRIISLFFVITFAMLSIGNAAIPYYMSYNIGGDAKQLSWFMAFGSIPALIFLPLIPFLSKRFGKKALFYISLSIGMIGFAMIYVFTVMPEFEGKMVAIYAAQFIKSVGVVVASGYMWVLVPDVIAYGEYVHGRRISGIVNALTGIFYKAGMALGGVVPGLVLAWVGFDSNYFTQSAEAQRGILWLMTVIPGILLIVSMIIISRYDLDDKRIDQINREIEEKYHTKKTHRPFKMS